MTLNKKTFRLATALIPVLFLAGVSAASATTATAGGGLPWEGALGNLVTALTGHTAQLICVIAIFVAGIALIFGEDLGHFARRILMIVIGAAFLIGGGGFVTNFLGGAHI